MRLTLLPACQIKKTVTFNSGNNHSVEIFAGTWANGDTWMRMDTFRLTKN